MTQMQIPYSDKIDTASLARLFDNKSESYKLFWFKAILHEVGLGRSVIPFRDLIERMIVDAWYMVSEYKLNLGPADTLEKTVLYIAENENFLPTEKEEVLLSYLRNSDDKTLKNNMQVLENLNIRKEYDKYSQIKLLLNTKELSRIKSKVLGKLKGINILECIKKIEDESFKLEVLESDIKYIVKCKNIKLENRIQKIYIFGNQERLELMNNNNFPEYFIDITFKIVP